MTEKTEKNERNGNAVYIGKRPTMNYVMAAMMVLNRGDACIVKARGRSISHAVDVCEILRNRFLKGTEYGSIELSTEELTGEEGKLNNVSSIEITLQPQK